MDKNEIIEQLQEAIDYIILTKGCMDDCYAYDVVYGVLQARMAIEEYFK